MLILLIILLLVLGGGGGYYGHSRWGYGGGAGVGIGTILVVLLVAYLVGAFHQARLTIDDSSCLEKAPLSVNQANLESRVCREYHGAHDTLPFSPTTPALGWLYTDDVYVDYLNTGYFLCEPAHPGVYLSVNID
jgi:hypothetical protein